MIALQSKETVMLETLWIGDSIEVYDSASSLNKLSRTFDSSSLSPEQLAVFAAVHLGRQDGRMYLKTPLSTPKWCQLCTSVHHVMLLRRRVGNQPVCSQEEAWKISNDLYKLPYLRNKLDWEMAWNEVSITLKATQRVG